MAHALLSPSSAARWLACTPSARLESQFPDSSGAAAAEGTVAHALGELLLREWLEVVEIEDFQVLLADIEGSEYYGPDMQRYAEDYRDFVIERYFDAWRGLADRVKVIPLLKEGERKAPCREPWRGSIVVLAERHGTTEVLTLDLRHFQTLRVDGRKRFRILPVDA